MSEGHASFCVYRVEYENSDGVWKELPITRGQHGVPYPLVHAGFCEDHNYYGYEQAMALAWEAKAHTNGRGIKELFKYKNVRVVKYQAVVDYKVEATEEFEILPHTFAGMNLEPSND